MKNSPIEPNSEKCNFPPKDENVYEINRYDLGQKNLNFKEYNQRIFTIIEKSENMEFLSTRNTLRK